MSRIESTVFGPMQPKIEPEFLPPNSAVLAKNMRLGSGALDPLRAPAPVPGVTVPGSAQVKTLYRAGKQNPQRNNYWFKFDGDVNIVRGPVVGDLEEKTYWTDTSDFNPGGYPKKTKADLAGLVLSQAITPSSLKMGVPPPGWAGPYFARTYQPTLTVTGTPNDTTSTPITSTYIVTYVSAWNEESAPSLASAVVSWRIGQTVRITLPGVLSGPYNITQVRIYRGNVGSARSSYQLVATVGVASAYYDDNKDSSLLGEGCPSFDWLPPSDGMRGLVDMGNGILAGFEDATIYFCEPNYPYAWPATYDMTVSSPIVGMAVFGQTLVVAHRDGVTLITGSDPANMTSETPAGLQSCVSKRSMAGVQGGVVYASPIGLCFIGPSGARVITESILSVDQWKAYKPSSIHAYALDNRYYAFYDNGTKQGCLVFSFGDDAGLIEVDTYCTAAYVDGGLAALFLNTYAGSTNTLQEWDTGSNMTAVWASKDYRFHSSAAMSCARVEADVYPVTLKFIADGAVKWTQSVPNAFPFRLPDGRNYVVSFQVESAYRVTKVRVASSMKELGDG